VTAASTIADRESFLRSARSAICFRRSGDATHLLVQDASLTGCIVRLVVEHSGELFRRPRISRLLGNGDMVGKLGFATQAAIGGILFRLLDLTKQHGVRCLRR
jgi:hypothetical protein